MTTFLDNTKKKYNPFVSTNVFGIPQAPTRDLSGLGITLPEPVKQIQGESIASPGYSALTTVPQPVDTRTGIYFKKQPNKYSPQLPAINEAQLQGEIASHNNVQTAPQVQYTADNIPVVNKPDYTAGLQLAKDTLYKSNPALAEQLWGKQAGTVQNQTADGLITPQLTPEQQARIDLINKINADKTAAYNAPQLTPEQQYAENLKAYQSQIDNINSVYSDLMNSARARAAVREKGALGSARAEQARSGLLGSGFARAQNAKVEQSQNELLDAELANLRAQQTKETDRLTGLAHQDATAETKAKADAKAKGADFLLQHLNDVDEYRSGLMAKWINGLLNSDVKLSDFSPEQIKEILKTYKVSKSELENAYNNAQTTAQQAADKLALSTKKTNAEIAGTQAKTAKTKAEAGQIGKESPNTAATIAAADRRAAEKIEAENNKPLTTAEVKQRIYNAMAQPDWNVRKKGQSKSELKDAQKKYIMLLGGNPSDYGY